MKYMNVSRLQLIKTGKTSILEIDDKKPPSAKTITLRPKSTDSVKSNGSVTATPDSCQQPQNNKNQATTNSDTTGETEEEEEAATKIQAAFRGHKARQSMKQPSNKTEMLAQGHQDEPSREELENEFRSDDQELCNAATKIQASFRGHLTRKQEAEKKHDGGSATKSEKEHSEIDDIDLADPELNKAAVKIQASFRGHLVRKEHDDEIQNN